VNPRTPAGAKPYWWPLKPSGESRRAYMREERWKWRENTRKYLILKPSGPL